MSPSREGFSTKMSQAGLLTYSKANNSPSHHELSRQW